MDGVSAKFWHYGTTGLTSNRRLATLPQQNTHVQRDGCNQTQPQTWNVAEQDGRAPIYHQNCHMRTTQQAITLPSPCVLYNICWELKSLHALASSPNSRPMANSQLAISAAGAPPCFCQLQQPLPHSFDLHAYPLLHGCYCCCCSSIILPCPGCPTLHELVCLLPAPAASPPWV